MLTVPNALTALRLLLVAGFAVLVLGAGAPVAAGALLGVAGVTDFLDGYIARRFAQESALGKVLDPTVDRVLLVTAASVIVAAGAVPLLLALVVVVREAVVAITALVLAARGARPIDVVFVGKAGTFALMCCFPLLLIGHGNGAFAHDVHLGAEIGLVPGLGLSLAAAAAYVPAARAALADRPARRDGGARWRRDATDATVGAIWREDRGGATALLPDPGAPVKGEA